MIAAVLSGLREKFFLLVVGTGFLLPLLLLTKVKEIRSGCFGSSPLRKEPGRVFVWSL